MVGENDLHRLLLLEGAEVPLSTSVSSGTPRRDNQPRCEALPAPGLVVRLLGSQVLAIPQETSPTNPSRYGKLKHKKPLTLRTTEASLKALLMFVIPRTSQSRQFLSVTGAAQERSAVGTARLERGTGRLSSSLSARYCGSQRGRHCLPSGSAPARALRQEDRRNVPWM